MNEIIVDLRKQKNGKPIIISNNGWSLDLTNVKDKKLKVGFILGQGGMEFESYKDMDDFIAQFTGHADNISSAEMGIVI
jgi:hypothetical protein